MKQSFSPNVYIRFKPNSKESIEFPNNTSIVVHGIQKKSYTFDYVFQPSNSTRDLFQICCKNHVLNCMNNITKSALVFVYGNTGTGKTYTIGLLENMDENSEGLIPLSLKHIFSAGCDISISFYQIYNEQVFDLLNNNSKPLQVRQNQKQPYLQGLLQISVSNYLEAAELVNIGRDQRRIAEQRMNRNSSRSHAILTIYIHHQNSVSKLCFVDLAGSERLKQSQSKGLNMTQAVHINSSLSSLQTCLVGMASNCLPSFRACKLTRLLRPFFSTPVSLIVTSNGNNMQNIEFAKRCKNIKIFQQSQDQQTLSRIRYLQQQLMKARKSLKDTTSFTPRKTMNKQNRQRTPKSRNDHSMSQSTKTNHNISNLSEDRNQSKYLLKIISKLITMLQSCCKTFENLHKNSIDMSGQAYEFIKQLNLQNLNINKFIDERLSFLKTQTKLLKIPFIPKQVLNSINDSQKFNRKMNQLGNKISQISNNLFHSNQYVQQICTRELKCYLLQKKGLHNQDIITYLLSKVDRKCANDVQAQLKRMGVRIEVQSHRNSFIRIQQS